MKGKESKSQVLIKESFSNFSGKVTSGRELNYCYNMIGFNEKQNKKLLKFKEYFMSD